MNVCGRPSFVLHTMSLYLESTWSPKGARRNLELFTKVGIGDFLEFCVLGYFIELVCFLSSDYTSVLH